MTDSKADIRRRAYKVRNSQGDKDQVSQEICGKFIELQAYRNAETVMWYVHCRSEVRTVPALIRALTQHKRIVIPYCTKDSQGHNMLGLWQLHDLSELVPGTWGIMEPPKSQWQAISRQVDPATLDLIMVPGVAFDKSGGRLGNGAGYYDRLLDQVRVDAICCGVCYESQIFPEIPMDEDDIYMDMIITEQTIYHGDN